MCVVRSFIRHVWGLAMNLKICCPEFCIHITNIYLHIHICRRLWAESKSCEFQNNFFNELHFQASDGESPHLFLVWILFFPMRPGIVFNWLYSRTLERNCGFTDSTSSWGPQAATSRTHLLATGWLNPLLKHGFPLYFSSPSFYFSNFWDEFLWIPCLIKTVRIHIWTPFSLSITNQLR